MALLSRRSFGLLAGAIAGLAAAAPRKAQAEPGRAPDVVLLCEVTLRPAMQAIGRAWQAGTGVPLRILAAPRSDMLLEQIFRGQRADLLIAQGPDVPDAAVRRGLIKVETRTDPWRNRLVIASRDGGGTPVALRPGFDLAKWLADGKLALPDAPLSPAGADAQAVLATLGLAAPAAGQVMLVESTVTVAKLVASGAARFGLAYATDVAATPGLAVAATLPDTAYPALTYAVALTRNVLSSQAMQFRAFLQGDEARGLVKAGGLEVLA